MKLFSDKHTAQAGAWIMLAFVWGFAVTEILCGLFCREMIGWMAAVWILVAAVVWFLCYRYIQKQNAILEEAIAKIETFLEGDTDARIECEEEGEIYRLFHSVNTLASVLNAHAANELREKEFLKGTIADISHQLKTPLAALNIYNGLLQDETATAAEIREFTNLSEQELDRIETLVQNMLKITRLDAGAILFEKKEERLSEIMKELEVHFEYRAKQENKKFTVYGDDKVVLSCDRDWLLEAFSNITKNAFDHTSAGDSISIEWKKLASVVQVRIKDTGYGIHPEDLHHIFKRFYRSRFSKETQGIGLGLPLAKAIIEAQDGSVELDSELNVGTTFVISFYITKL